MPDLATSDDSTGIAAKIAGILNECRISHAVQARKLKELSSFRSSTSPRSLFFSSFVKTIAPLFDFPKRTSSFERVVRFVSAFAARRDEKDAAGSDEFLNEFLRFLLVAANSGHRNARFRACQIVSEIIMRLPDDADVSNEVWDEVIENMKQRVEDKVPAIRGFAVRALSRFVNDEENGDTINLFLQALPQESNAEVRKTIVLSLPPSNDTSTVIVASTLDVNESVRRAAYCVLASKFPLQSLSIKLRTTVLQRGLSDRSPAVNKDCLKMLKDEWLTKCCNSDPVGLLRYLDVETYETVGETVMGALLKDGVVRVQEGQSIRQYLTSRDKGEGDDPAIQLMESEVALYWKTICKHLQAVAQAKGSDAATTTGTEAVVYASEASDNNDLLDGILPVTVSDYVDLVKAHLSAGPNYRFASRQLLLLCAMLDFSDTTNRKVAGSFIHELLLRPFEFEVDEEGNKIILGDGISLGGDKEWARAVSELTRKVHASVGEFETVVTSVIEELASPCRERTADVMQWMHCLSVTGLLLENIESFRGLHGKAIEPSEILHSLLLPGAKHIHVDVQRVATRCLCIFGIREKRPNEEVVKQLRMSFIHGPSTVRVVASMALTDLVTWHGPEVVDKAIGLDMENSNSNVKNSFIPVILTDSKDDLCVGVLDLLYSGLDREDCDATNGTEDQESVRSIIGEGFAKILLLNESYPSISPCLHPWILCRLVGLYFSDEANDLHRLKQCLSVFFEHYPALSYSHKKCVSRAFIPVMKSMWPGICGRPGGSSVVVSRLRKRANQASRFMLQMMQMPLFSNENEEHQSSEQSSENPPTSAESSPDVECGEEGLAIRIGAEVVTFPEKRTAAGKSYVLALCRIALLIQFRPSEQVAVKCMRGLLNTMITFASSDKELARELNRMASRLKSLDMHPDDELSPEQTSAVFEKLGLDVNVELENLTTTLPPTPAPRSTRAAPVRRRARRELSSEEDEEEAAPSINVVPITPSLASARSQRASKTVAMSKMNIKTTIEFSDGEIVEESDVTSDDTSDESCDE